MDYCFFKLLKHHGSSRVVEHGFALATFEFHRVKGTRRKRREKLQVVVSGSWCGSVRDLQGGVRSKRTQVFEISAFQLQGGSLTYFTVSLVL